MTPILCQSKRCARDACSPVAEGLSLAPPLEETVLRGGLYARLRYRGPYADMKGAYRWLLGIWLPQSGYEPDDDPIFEAYLNNPPQVAPDGPYDRHPFAAEDAVTSLAIASDAGRCGGGFRRVP